MDAPPHTHSQLLLFIGRGYFHPAVSALDLVTGAITLKQRPFLQQLHIKPGFCSLVKARNLWIRNITLCHPLGRPSHPSYINLHCQDKE